jgi:hypothetical protein
MQPSPDLSPDAALRLALALLDAEAVMLAAMLFAIRSSAGAEPPQKAADASGALRWLGARKSHGGLLSRAGGSRKVWDLRAGDRDPVSRA